MKVLMPIILAAAAIGLFVMYTNPTYQTVKSLQGQSSQYDDALNQSAKLRQLRDTLLARRNSFSQQNIQALQRLLPDNVDNIRLIIDINDIAARYHLQTNSLALQAAAGGVGSGEGPLGSVDLSFTVHTDYKTFEAFLDDLERSMRLLEITDIKFSSGTSDTTDYTVTVRTFWLR